MTVTPREHVMANSHMDPRYRERLLTVLAHPLPDGSDGYWDRPETHMWHWDGVRDGETPEAYFERHAASAARQGFVPERAYGVWD